MDDIQLFENFHNSLSLYCENLGEEIKPDSFSLVDYGDQDVKITSWNLKIPQPTKEELKKYSMDDVNIFIEKRDKESKKVKIIEGKNFKLIKLICDKIGLDINELLNQME